MSRSQQQGTGDGEIIMITEEEREEDHVGRQAIHRRKEYMYREKSRRMLKEENLLTTLLEGSSNVLFISSNACS